MIESNNMNWEPGPKNLPHNIAINKDQLFLPPNADHLSIYLLDE